MNLHNLAWQSMLDRQRGGRYIHQPYGLPYAAPAPPPFYPTQFTHVVSHRTGGPHPPIENLNEQQIRAQETFQYNSRSIPPPPPRNTAAFGYPQQCPTNSSLPTMEQRYQFFNHNNQNRSNNNNKRYNAYNNRKRSFPGVPGTATKRPNCNKDAALNGQANTADANYCQVCEKDFSTKQKLMEHVEENHISCDGEGCTYSAPPSLLTLHRLTHLKDSNGQPLMDSDEEVKKWLLSRKMNFPSKKNVSLKVENSNYDKENSETSVLEKTLREAILFSVVSTKASAKVESAFIPKLSKMVFSMPTALEPISNHSRNSKKIKFRNGLYSYGPSYAAEPFPICKHLLMSKSCRFGGKCSFSHNIESYKNWQRAQHMISAIEVPKRPPLLHQLLSQDITKYENTILKCLEFFVNNNFLDTSSS